jgi:hypothetical protein
MNNLVLIGITIIFLILACTAAEMVSIKMTESIQEMHEIGVACDICANTTINNESACKKCNILHNAYSLTPKSMKDAYT